MVQRRTRTHGHALALAAALRKKERKVFSGASTNFPSSLYSHSSTQARTQTRTQARTHALRHWIRGDRGCEPLVSGFVLLLLVVVIVVSNKYSLFYLCRPSVFTFS